MVNHTAVSGTKKPPPKAEAFNDQQNATQRMPKEMLYSLSFLSMSRKYL